MLSENKNIYNIVKKCDYFTIRDFVIKSFEKIANEEKQQQQQLTKVFNENRNAIKEIQKEEEEVGETLKNTDRIINSNNNESCDYDRAIILPPHLLKLKIRNKTEYLKWRISVLERDNFRCRVCSASIKDNKNLRLEVHHAKSFNDICNENNITTIKQALSCKEIWRLDNGISLCFSCHKDIERIRTRIRNIFFV
jgi:DNA repair exonuclease SbcCD ATPase subunit